jgi:hypothetical protein
MRDSLAFFGQTSSFASILPLPRRLPFRNAAGRIHAIMLQQLVATLSAEEMGVRAEMCELSLFLASIPYWLFSQLWIQRLSLPRPWIALPDQRRSVRFIGLGV